MEYGFVLPGGTAAEQLAQARLAEEAGWDGVFVWEAGYGVDAWSLLAAMAARTSLVKLGTLLTPLPWRRPWKVASQVMTLDQISGGRAILTVGLGALATDLPDTGEVTDLRTRAEMLDEGIDLIRGLWGGRQSFRGQHYTYECARDDLAQMARPVRDRIPIWVVGAWPRPKSMRRAALQDGWLPNYVVAPGQERGEWTPALLGEGVEWIRRERAGHGLSMDGYEIVAEGFTSADDPDPAATVGPWAAAGATWWIDADWSSMDPAEVRAAAERRLQAGPPRVD